MAGGPLNPSRFCLDLILVEEGFPATAPHHSELGLPLKIDEIILLPLGSVRLFTVGRRERLCLVLGTLD